MDYSLLLVFYKKPITKVDPSSDKPFKPRSLSIMIKKGEEGNYFEVEELESPIKK